MNLSQGLIHRVGRKWLLEMLVYPGYIFRAVSSLYKAVKVATSLSLPNALILCHLMWTTLWPRTRIFVEWPCHGIFYSLLIIMIVTWLTFRLVSFSIWFQSIIRRVFSHRFRGELVGRLFGIEVTAPIDVVSSPPLSASTWMAECFSARRLDQMKLPVNWRKNEFVEIEKKRERERKIRLYSLLCLGWIHEAM